MTSSSGASHDIIPAHIVPAHDIIPPGAGIILRDWQGSISRSPQRTLAATLTAPMDPHRHT